MITVSAVVRDNGAFDRIKNTAKRYTAKVQVGYFGNARHTGDAKKRPITLGNLARIHELGAKHTPKRPFISPALKQNRGKYLRLVGGSFVPVLQGQYSTHQLWQLVGQEAVKDVQAYMVTASFTPLSPKTIKQKGSSKPLIDTGQLRQSVTYRVKS